MSEQSQPSITDVAPAPRPAAADSAAPAERPAGPPPRERPRANRRYNGSRGEGITWPVVLIFVGVMLLLYTTGRQSGAAWWRLWTLWPVLLILIGLDLWLRHAAAFVRVLVALGVLVALVAAALYLIAPPRGEARTLTCTAGEATQGRVVLEMGVGRLQVGASERPRADFAGGLFQDPGVDLRCDNDADPVSLEVHQRPENAAWWSRKGDSFWNLVLNRAIPLQSLGVKIGVGDGVLDLRPLNLQDLRLETGVGRMWVTLPGPEGAAMTTVWVRSGVGSIEVTIPPGVAAEIHVGSGVGHFTVDQGRFPWRDGVYRSEGYETAPYRLRIDIRAGVGLVTVK